MPWSKSSLQILLGWIQVPFHLLYCGIQDSETMKINLIAILLHGGYSAGIMTRGCDIFEVACVPVSRRRPDPVQHTDSPKYFVDQ